MADHPSQLSAYFQLLGESKAGFWRSKFNVCVMLIGMHHNNPGVPGDQTNDGWYRTAKG
jgi:hypothetical protein